jgi:hypothetical protein
MVVASVRRRGRARHTGAERRARDGVNAVATPSQTVQRSHREGGDLSERPPWWAWCAMGLLMLAIVGVTVGGLVYGYVLASPSI